MNTYIVKVDSVECAVSKYGLSNVVIAINWSYTASNGVKDYVVSGRIDVAEPNPLEFTPIETLTNEIVLVWLNSIINFEEKNVYMDQELLENEEVEEIITITLLN
jgi:hypothetical protein